MLEYGACAKVHLSQLQRNVCAREFAELEACAARALGALRAAR
jgi:hypothetical protein